MCHCLVDQPRASLVCWQMSVLSSTAQRRLGTQSQWTRGVIERAEMTVA